MINAPNIEKVGTATYVGTAHGRIWRITPARGAITVPYKDVRVPARWVARNGFKALYARTLPELSKRLEGVAP